MEKKGQLTIFIIIAILIIAVVALFFMFRGNLNLPGKPVAPEVASIKNFVQECLEEDSNSVIRLVGQGGGYYVFPKLSTDTGIPYYLIGNRSYMLSKQQIEKEISNYITRNLEFCIGGFTDFTQYNITRGKLNTAAIIQDEKVLVKLNYPLTIKKGESVSRIQDFETEVPVRMGIIYDIIKKYQDQEKPIEGMCFNCQVDELEAKGLSLDSYDYNNETVIFVLKDKYSIINNKPFEWIFANKY